MARYLLHTGPSFILLKEEGMKLFCKVYLYIVALFTAMLFSSLSYAQEATPQPAAQATTAVEAPEEGLTANLNVSFYSQYIWRGIELSKDSLVIFPTMTMGYKGFAVNLWADVDTDFNNPLPGESSQFKLQETDITLSYTNSLKALKTGYTFGWIFYDTDGFHGHRPTDNQELFLTLTPELPLKPTFTVYSELQVATAWYFTLGLSHSFTVHKDWSFDVGGYGSYFYGKQEDYSGLSDANLSAGLKIPINKHMSITPKVQYSFPLSTNASNRLKSLSFNGDHSQFFYGGLVFDYNLP
jgi:hypothetical protein